ncbi:murein hydrolase activator EnvC family protein [Brachybacterium sacelli]|uniref:Murein DD-endopeptidase MepM/ murein hydrolase activator NlpD n=1 Tax=Brachybacterium sacelli TaxID=173364 RepID=A0ABS4X104_9MICO|nr:M23 family metallopeptidase [Brachybacterium sacelli]MBP2382127.1 murein DD-endopeptidase MepM/ murein hydrolase activator NlpD [Brachybacterium sacelli]
MAPRHLSVSAPPTPRPLLRALRIVLILLCLLTALAVPGPAGADTPRWQWPVPSPHPVIHPFDPPEDPYGPGHRGIDVGVPGAGTAVHAVEAGTVRFSGTVAGRGVVSVLHADGLISTYEPVAGSLEKGTRVRAGEVLGKIAGPGASHCEEQVCLHLGARRAQGYVDPQVLLGARGPSVLLPWAAGAQAVAGSSEPRVGIASAGSSARATTGSPVGERIALLT